MQYNPMGPPPTCESVSSEGDSHLDEAMRERPGAEALRRIAQLSDIGAYNMGCHTPKWKWGHSIRREEWIKGDWTLA